MDLIPIPSFLLLFLYLTSSILAQAPGPASSETKYEIGALQKSLAAKGTQATTSELLFNTTILGRYLAEMPGATLLSPQDSAWSRLESQKDGPELKQLLNGTSGSTVLSNLLKYHIVTKYLLYVDLQLSTPGTALPTLLNESVYLHPFNGQNVFYVNGSDTTINVTSNEPDINQDGLISIQGITQVLIPDLSTLYDSVEGPAPAPGPSYPVIIPLTVGEGAPSIQLLENRNVTSGCGKPLIAFDFLGFVILATALLTSMTLFQ